MQLRLLMIYRRLLTGDVITASSLTVCHDSHREHVTLGDVRVWSAVVQDVDHHKTVLTIMTAATNEDIFRCSVISFITV